MYNEQAKHWTVTQDLLVSFFAAGPIPRDVWQDYCDTIASASVERVLATSIGLVEVDAVQRKQVNEALKLDPIVRVAVVTDEPLVRGLMTATGWLGRVDVRAFPWHRLSDAFRHLEPRGVDEKQALDLVDTIRRRVEARDR
jgi:hypothetical protein